MRLRAASKEGKLVYGECGGLLALCRSIHDGMGEHPMAGVFDHRAELTRERQGLSYVLARGSESNFLFPGAEIRGHEFHYTRLHPLSGAHYAYRVMRGSGIDGSSDGLMIRRTIGTYMHQHALSNQEWGRAWVRCSSCP